MVPHALVDGTDLLGTDHLCFTEILADPRPPARTRIHVLEVLNDAPWAIQPDGFCSWIQMKPSLHWVTRPLKAFCRSWCSWTVGGVVDGPWSALPVLRVSGWSGSGQGDCFSSPPRASRWSV